MISGQRSHRREGFTLIELLVSSVVGLILLGGVVQLFTVQSHGYRKQREVIDVRETSREAAALLSWDLRGAGIGSSTPVAITGNSIAVRSPRGLGTICAKHATLPRYALWRTGGNINATIDDSALVYQVGRDNWSAAKITAAGTPASMGVAACAWPGARAPDIVVELATTVPGDTAFIQVGAPLRAFRQVEYAEYQLNNRWWLGRRVGASATYEQMTGPLLAPASNGLVFTYYDSTGAVTATPSAVNAVAFTLRTESFKSTYVGSGYTYQRDSLTTRVSLRQ
ncbi:MAG TPA: prepilin-type N-terminal cleavage/methylation domain-containing protein [Gemmatimonadaceae bacterium]|jgi:prepilin-type N-terminal cleavage/methylation domain-containing protein|nr:prepilin-type N-terminal cleavage/methylation domain-containing protein [Gemmatimonadaceae bacterium]